jgi:hypothetical protein
MRMPVANPRREILIHRPHARKAHHVSPGKFTFGVSGLQTFDDLVRILALHRVLFGQGRV